MRVIIVEDESKARQLIAHLLNAVDERIQIVGQADNAVDGQALIERLLPDAAFVDIKMPGMTGLEMIRSLAPKMYLLLLLAVTENLNMLRRLLNWGLKAIF